jgi:hypothetical protein
MITYSLEKVNHFILQKQHLTEETIIDDIKTITDDIFGLHATGATTPFLSLHSRMNQFRKKILIKELTEERSIGKLRCVRRTIYIIPKKMLPVVFAATKKMQWINSDLYKKYLGVNEGEYNEISKRIQKLIDNRGLSAKEIKNEITTKANISSIINLMCDQGLIYRGFPKSGWKSNLHTYYNFKHYFPDINLDTYKEKDAQKMLIKKYIKVFGPVTLRDIVWWTGFKTTTVKQIIEEINDDLREIKVDKLDGTLIVEKNDLKKLSDLKFPKKHVINILPLLDPLVMGYKQRDRFFEQSNYNYFFDKSGNATNTILLNGRNIGVWDIDEPYVKMFLLEKISGEIKKDIIKKLIKLGEFFTEKHLSFKQCKNMVPLDKRTAGSMMKPLKK